MKKKLIIWDLFGGGCNSISRAINEYGLGNEYFVYTFDVVETHVESNRGQLKYKFQKYINIDLSQDNIVSIFKEMIDNNIIQKPDIILSSTLCQSFSKILSMVGGGTCFWKQSIKGDRNSPLIERDIKEFEELKNGFTKNLKAEKQLFIKRLGEKCAKNTVLLIKSFNPDFWYIENPSSSLLFQYLRVNLKFDGFLNIACFGSYDFPQNKSGGFYSNIKITMKTKRRPPTYETQWEEVTKEYYDKWIYQVNYKKEKLGGSGDKRHVKVVFDSIEKKNKYYRRWYVDKGYKFGDKGHSSLKKTTMTLGKLTKHKFKLVTKNEFDTRQIGEANETSHIPPGVIYEILKAFKN